MPCPYLDTRWHGYVKVTQYMLRVLILGALAQKRQKPRGILVAISDLAQIVDRKRKRRRKEVGRNTETM